MRHALYTVGLLGILGAGFLGGCDLLLATDPPGENRPPDTELANVPVAGDTLFALVTLHWDGGDDDGFVAGYEYRIRTRFMTEGDSAVTDWQATEVTSLTIAFPSTDDLNEQVFEVRAVDNEGAHDPEPAQKRFYTTQTVFPETELASPESEQTFFALDETTDWWQGITITFTASDADGEVVDYAWSVDDGELNWTRDTTLVIGPEAFSPLEGEHVIRVTSRDNTGLVDPVGDSVRVRLIRPAFDRSILIIDETLESEQPFNRISADDAAVDAFYADIFGTDNSWDFVEQGMPPKEVLGQYQLVIWHADNNYANSANAHKLPLHADEIADYLNVGGDFVMSGWRMLESFATGEAFPKVFPEGTFIRDYLHINAADETPFTFSAEGEDFVGAVGTGKGFHDVAVDRDKLLGVFPYFGGLAQINVIPQRGGFTEIIYAYESRGELTEYRGATVGLRYYGTAFDAIVLGFPLFFLEQEDARQLGQDVLQSLGYR